MTHAQSPNYKLSDTLSLGQTVEYKDEYTPALLQGVPRKLSREHIGVLDKLPFTGIDIWNGYEVSWLNMKGKPQVAILRCWVNIDSENLIESKSFKLYLNSLNQSKFDSWENVASTIKTDLSAIAKSQINVQLFPINELVNTPIGKPDGECLDHQDIDIDCYTPKPDFLYSEPSDVEETVEEALYSELLKSNCLITSQPDWATLVIKYSGKKINREGLLKYIVSFRQHNEFHEQCVERIFCDILKQCSVDKLTVYARYTRRGGLDINPFRSNFETPYADSRLPRQ
jgi:7-cyano-7-deazaguanine reductase